MSISLLHNKVQLVNEIQQQNERIKNLEKKLDKMKTCSEVKNASWGNFTINHEESSQWEPEGSTDPQDASEFLSFKVSHLSVKRAFII